MKQNIMFIVLVMLLSVSCGRYKIKNINDCEVKKNCQSDMDSISGLLTGDLATVQRAADLWNIGIKVQGTPTKRTKEKIFSVDIFKLISPPFLLRLTGILF